MLDLLRQGPKTTGELASHFPFSRYATMKHLKVLDGAGLLRVERRGRERLNHLNPTPIQAIYRRWIRPFEVAPADRLLRLRETAESRSAGIEEVPVDGSPQDPNPSSSAS